MPEAWIIDGARTPRGKGKPGGGLNHLHPQELLAQCLNALPERTGVDPKDVDDVIIGNGMNWGEHGDCIGRMAELLAGWPVETPAFTLNRFCGSGQQAVTLAAMGVASGMQDLVVGGGVESMSRWANAAGTTDKAPTIDGANPDLRALHPIVPQGISADLIATLEGFSREDCDRLAATSQDRAAKALAEGRFDRSMIAVKNPDGSVALDTEEHPRAGTTVESLAKLPPSFEQFGENPTRWYDESFDQMTMRVYPQLSKIDHVHHAGNSSGVVDGASALLIASSDYAQAHGLTPRARIRMTAAAGAEPVIMLTAPAPASKLCLQKAGMTTDDIDLWEINEAFASVVLKALRELEIDPEKVNVNGGAMALGHPIGATGGILLLTALDELERSDKTTALVTMCTGGGMGTATILERV